MPHTAKYKSKTRGRSAFTTSRHYDISSRLERALSQSMYLIEANWAVLLYHVMGNSDNDYQVNLNTPDGPRCTCPDSERGNLCKHVLFVLARVLDLPTKEDVFKNERWTEEQIDELRLVSVAKGVSLRSVSASKHLSVELQSCPPLPEPSDMCTICFEVFPLSTPQHLTYCIKQCKQWFHKKCIDKWSHSRRQKNLDVACPLCRCSWRSGVFVNTVPE